MASWLDQFYPGSIPTVNPIPTVPMPNVAGPTPMPPMQGQILRGGNPFYNPNWKYGAPESMYDSELSRRMGELNPGSEWERVIAQQRMGGNDRMGQFARNQQSRMQSAYGAAQLANPALTLRDFLKTTNAGPALQNEWRGLSASQRGLNPSARSQVIRWG